LIVNTRDGEKSEDESHCEITQEINENGLEIEVDTILHAIGCETDYYWSHP